jgi:AraC-like DNA-binding protein
MTSQTVQSVESTVVFDLNASELGALDSDPKLREACCLLEQVRAVLDSDPVAARSHLERLARILGATGCMEAHQGSHRSGLAPWQARLLREYIAAHYCHPLPLSELAALVRLSTGHLARAFRQSFGVSPRTFIIQQRLDAAKRLILESETPLAEIALSCGMADQSHLTRLFTRSVGTSPAAWRRYQAALTVSQAT